MERPKFNSFKELYTYTRNIHFDFREHYTPKQTTYFCVLAVASILYSIFAKFYYTSGASLIEINHVNVQFGLMAGLSCVNLVACLVLKNRHIIKESRNRDEALEIMMSMAAFEYIMWGFVSMVISIIENRETNYLVILMVYTVCSVFFYLSPHHYIVMYSLCILVAKIILNVYKGGVYDKVIFTNVIIFGCLLTLAGLSKYFASLGQFQAKREADQLKEELVANNEELVATNDDLTDMTEKLRQANEQQKLFTASMNHELRSPLNGIIGILQILRDDESLTKENEENVDRAIVSSKTMLQIVNDLLDFAKLEAGEFTIVNDEFNLHNLLDTVETLSKGQAEAKGLKFISENDDKMPCMMVGDSVRIQQIIVNLLSNGIKYTKEGYVKINVSVDSENNLAIAVSDSGQGISEDAMDQLFVPFKRINSKANNKIQGTGLGLSVVKNLIDKMGGTITVSSEIGKGSVFAVKIPVEISENNIEYGEYVASKKTEKNMTYSLQGKKIFCVDDNKVNLAVFRGMFKGTDADITVCSTGTDAVETLSNRKFDIVFLDHMMPDMDGLEVFNNMKKQGTMNSETPAVMLTGNASEESKKEYADKGLDGYLAKPIMKEDLYKIIEELLNKKNKS